MAREFTFRDARELVKQHQALLDTLHQLGARGEVLAGKVRQSADALVSREILRVISNIPVDELGKYRKGLRLKPLVDYGFTTVADVFAATVPNLEAINGISLANAVTLKKIVADLVERTRQETKIRLTLDDKSAESNQLVTDLAIYYHSRPLIQQAGQLDDGCRDMVQTELAAVGRATGVVRWLFSGKDQKERAVAAYQSLREWLAGEYAVKVRDWELQLKQVARTTSTQAWADFAAHNVEFYQLLEETNPGLLGTADAIYGLPEELARAIQDQCLFPDGLKCALRRYQEWGVKYILHQEKVLLGDEMGLGKTVQAIATMVSLKNTGATHFVVVCPASVLTNWCREITKHSLLRVTKVHGAGCARALAAWLASGGVAVTTYETTGYFKLPDDFKFELLVVDEAHYIKNPGAKRTENTQRLCQQAERLLFMTGTALENHVDEMIALIKMLQPAVARDLEHIAFLASAPQFRTKVAPVYYRRKREDVLTELPALIESQEWCTMTPAEEQVYEATVLARQIMAARRVSWNVPDLAQSSKANRLREIIAEATAEDRKVLVFSFFLDTVRAVATLLGSACLPPITGAMSPQHRQELIDQFNQAPAGTVLVAQIQAGGTGLNIQGASVVVICEPQVKPSIENQAIARAYRMGQARNVLVYRLLCEQSLDERLTEVLAEKQREFDAFADQSVAAAQELEVTTANLNQLITAEIERIQNKRGMVGKPTPPAV